MPEEYERGYESTSLRKGLKEDLKSLQRTDETYSDVIRRALTALGEKEDRQTSWFKRLAEAQQQQARLLVRMADEIGLDKELIPADMLDAEAEGDSGPMGVKRGTETTLDLREEERNEELREEFDAIAEADGVRHRRAQSGFPEDTDADADDSEKRGDN